MKHFFVFLSLLFTVAVSARELGSDANIDVALSDIRYEQFLLAESQINIECASARLNRVESTPDCVTSCRCVGHRKVFQKAKSMDVLIGPEDIYVCNTSDGWINDEVEFCANTSKGKIRAKTRKGFLRDCE